jgi:polyhydroxyalkanoate synthesis regulator phasin
MKMRGGEFGVDAYGYKDVGQNPQRRNFGLTGLTNDDYDAFKSYERNIDFANTRSSYEDLQKLHKQMMRTGLHAEEAKVLLDTVLSYNATVENGELPDWVKQYAEAVDEKLQQTKFALDSGDKSLARSY